MVLNSVILVIYPEERRFGGPSLILGTRLGVVAVYLDWRRLDWISSRKGRGEIVPCRFVEVLMEMVILWRICNCLPLVTCENPQNREFMRMAEVFVVDMVGYVRLLSGSSGAALWVETGGGCPGISLKLQWVVTLLSFFFLGM